MLKKTRARDTDVSRDHVDILFVPAVFSQRTVCHHCAPSSMLFAGLLAWEWLMEEGVEGVKILGTVFKFESKISIM